VRHPILGYRDGIGRGLQNDRELDPGIPDISGCEIMQLTAVMCRIS